jgi:predicted DNA-binding helix-hairpin-helix protein
MMMEALEKLKQLSEQMDLEPAEESGQPAVSACPKLSSRQKDAVVTTSASLPNGRQIRLLKTLLSSACERNCNYCPFRAGRNYRRVTFKPEEFAELFMRLSQAGITNGLFISSGIIDGGVRTQDQLIKTAELLRFRYHFRGYLHLKIMPGAEKAQVERAMQLADRVSINLEAPNSQRLQILAPKKGFFEELLPPLRWIQEIRKQQLPARAWNGRWPSSATQFVIGGAGESDLELMSVSQYLYRNLGLARNYYSAFRPVHDTPLDSLPAENPLRELRLYQASFLLRDYNFDVEDLPFNASGNLPLLIDPKQAWADEHLKGSPFEINLASQQELLRVPGIGPKGAQAILNARRHRTLANPAQLVKLGIAAAKAAPYLLFNGRQTPQQLQLL